jgi:uncharacterized protein (DUF58 family)
LFHILDESEVNFPFAGMMEFEEPESKEALQVDAASYRPDYLAELAEFRGDYQNECRRIGVDYVPLDTSMPFDKALLEYLQSRKSRF